MVRLLANPPAGSIWQPDDTYYMLVGIKFIWSVGSASIVGNPGIIFCSNPTPIILLCSHRIVMYDVTYILKDIKGKYVPQMVQLYSFNYIIYSIKIQRQLTG